MTDLEQVEIQIDMAHKLRKMRDNCVKLTASETWKDIITEGYFKEEAARLVMAKSSAGSFSKNSASDKPKEV